MRALLALDAIAIARVKNREVCGGEFNSRAKGEALAHGESLKHPYKLAIHRPFSPLPYSRGCFVFRRSCSIECCANSARYRAMLFPALRAATVSVR